MPWGFWTLLVSLLEMLVSRWLSMSIPFLRRFFNLHRFSFSSSRIWLSRVLLIRQWVLSHVVTSRWISCVYAFWLTDRVVMGAVAWLSTLSCIHDTLQCWLVQVHWLVLVVGYLSKWFVDTWILHHIRYVISKIGFIFDLDVNNFRLLLS